MTRKARRSGWRIGHLMAAVAASAFVAVLLKAPLDYALPLVSVAGLLIIASCLVAAVVQDVRDRRSRRPAGPADIPRSAGLAWLLAGAGLAVGAGAAFVLFPEFVVALSLAAGLVASAVVAVILGRTIG